MATRHPKKTADVVKQWKENLAAKIEWEGGLFETIVNYYGGHPSTPDPRFNKLALELDQAYHALEAYAEEIGLETEE